MQRIICQNLCKICHLEEYKLKVFFLNDIIHENSRRMSWIKKLLKKPRGV